MKKNIYIIAIILVSFVLPCTASDKGLVTQILHEMEEQYEINSDLTAQVTITQEKVSQGIQEIEYLFYRRDSDDSFLMAALSPEREKGNGYLEIDNNIWVYRKNTRTFQHVNRDEKVGDTGVSLENIENKNITELYAPVMDEEGKEILKEEILGKIPVYKFDVKAIVKDVTYPKHTYWVRKDNHLLLKKESYSLSGTLMQTVYYVKYTNIDSRFLAIKYIAVDEFEKGNKWIVDVSGISLEKVDNSIFTKAYLENLSK